MTDNQFIGMIINYWYQRGYAVAAEMRECSDQKYRYHAPRSNLVNGLPNGYRGELAISLFTPKRRGKER